MAASLVCSLPPRYQMEREQNAQGLTPAQTLTYQLSAAMKSCSAGRFSGFRVDSRKNNLLFPLSLLFASLSLIIVESNEPRKL